MGKMFDPKASNEQSGGDLPSFEGLIALVWFERKQNKKQTGYYLRGKYEVCTGPGAGKTFFANQSLDLSIAAGRLGVWCAAVGQEGSFDIENVEELKRVFLRKPFKAQVARVQNGNYTNFDIKRFTIASKLTEAERKSAEGWLLDQEQKRALAGGEIDDLDKAAGGGAPDFGDDDIPFAIPYTTPF
jgi:hypothetical protein